MFPENNNFIPFCIHIALVDMLFNRNYIVQKINGSGHNSLGNKHSAFDELDTQLVGAQMCTYSWEQDLVSQCNLELSALPAPAS